jgi:indolepyruvate ferredoxin oxidoreductase beta subunit
MSSNLPERTLTILIAALGGEGGGVMADWLIDAASACGFPAQSTSIPGVAQRTGATTYYLEIYPAKRELLAGREPVMALTPSPGNVDVMVSSEFIEAGRALQNGFVSPERTTLIASTHRIFATMEKMQMGDGRFDASRVREAAQRLAKKAVLFDMRALAQEHGTVINAVLFGAMIGSGALPLPREVCEAAIRRGGRGADASLRGFGAGYEIAAGTRAAPAEPPPTKRATELQEIVDLGVARLRDYQGESYAQLYRDRLTTVGASDPALAAEIARQLALWMSYEDIIRVADLKSRASRFSRVRREVGAKDNEPVVVIDYLKPGIEEFASLLPVSLGRRLLAWAEQLAALREAEARDSTLAFEIAACAGVLKGYGETHRRGKANFLAILDALVDNPPTADAREQAAAIRRAREAALADPEAKALSKQLGKPVTWLKPVV